MKLLKKIVIIAKLIAIILISAIIGIPLKFFMGLFSLIGIATLKATEGMEWMADITEELRDLVYESMMAWFEKVRDEWERLNKDE